MAVHAGTEGGFGVVAMNGDELFETDEAIELLKCFCGPGFGGNIIPSGEEMGGVGADTEAFGVGRVLQNPSQLLEGMAEGGPLPRCGFKGNPRFDVGQGSEYLIQSRDNLLQSLSLARAHMCAGMEHEERQEKLVGTGQFFGKGLARFFGKFGVHRREVDQVAAVAERGAEFAPVRMFVEGLPFGLGKRCGGKPLHVVLHENLHGGAADGKRPVDGEGNAARDGHVRANEERRRLGSGLGGFHVGMSIAQRSQRTQRNWRTQRALPRRLGALCCPAMFRFQTLWEARWIFAALFVLTGARWGCRAWITPWPTLLGVGLLLFSAYFFRDPDRAAPSDPRAVVAAADGVVWDIQEKEEPDVARAKMQRVGIFLSVFNVHTNRAPIDGKVIYSKEYEGAYLDARDPAVSDKNACRTWGFQNDRVTVVVRQLTGLIARRIVGWSKVGDTVQKGERFGMIRFGSRTEVYVPLNAEITVKRGDRVEGGVTVVARLRE